MAMKENSKNVLNYLKENKGVNLTAADVAKLFKSPPARTGDMVQMVGKSGLHSAILNGVDDTGITFYDANYGNPKNIIKERHMTFEEYATYLNCNGGGATIYSPNDQIQTVTF